MIYIIIENNLVEITKNKLQLNVALNKECVLWLVHALCLFHIYINIIIIKIQYKNKKACEECRQAYIK
jgi:hypothetical protein